MKRTIKLFILLFFLVVFIIPLKANATTYTLDQLRNMYPDGSTFSEVYSYRHNSDDNPGYNRQDVQINCAGFAATMYYKFYGIDHYWATRITNDIWQVEPGDIVRYLESSNPNDGHSVFVISKSGDRVTVAEANFGEYQRVKWGRQISISELSVGFAYIDKGLYPIGGIKTTPTVEKASNFKASYNTSTNKISASWNRVSRASDYNVLVFTESDAKNNKFTNPVAKENPTYNIGSVAPFSFDKSGTFYIYLQTVLDEYKSDLVGPIIIKKLSVSSVAIKDKPTGNVYVGDTFKLTGEKTPSDANYQSTLTWSSSDDSIATVGSSSGKVIVKKAGRVTITLTSGNGKTASYTFTAIEKIPAISISLNTDFKDLLVGESYQLNATVLPTNTTDKPVVWTSSDASVATVSSTGLVKGITSGDVEITATAGNQTANCRVIVSSSAIEKIDFSLPFAIEGGQYYMRANVTPSDANTSGITWTSSNSDVFSIESYNGDIALMKANKGGEVTLTIKAPNGVKKELKIKVYSKPSYVSVSASEPIYVGDTFDLTKDIRADNEYYDDFYYESSNPEIVEVLSNGKLHAKAKGNVYVYLRSRTYSNINAGTTITVKEIEPIEIKLNKTTLSLAEGKSETLTATISPSNAANKSVTWTSSNTSVATVSNGKVTAVKPGTAIITVQTSNGKTAKCTVTVSSNEVAVTGISLNKTTLSLVEENSETLTATITPSNATNKNVTWTSSNTSIATVSNGKVTAIKEGKTTITAKSINGKTASCTITVTKKLIDPTSVFLDKSSLELTVAEKYNFKVTILPTNVNNNKSYSFTSSNPQVVSVNGSEIHALKAGTAVITVKTANGKTGTCTVTVKAKDIAVTGISFNKTTLSLVEGNSETLTATIAPSNATNKNVTWTSSNTSIATVSNGKVVGVKAGTATITAKSNNGKTVTCAVTVTAKNNTVAVTGISFNKTTLSLVEGASETLTATIAPSNATNKNVTWTSSNTSIATVSNGKVVGVKAGTATITAKSNNGKTVTCTVTVTAKNNTVAVTGISFNKTTLSLKEGASETLTATITPSNATNKNVTWTSSNTSIATVSNGKVVGVKAGTATITAKSNNGKTVTCTVTVTQKEDGDSELIPVYRMYNPVNGEHLFTANPQEVETLYRFQGWGKEGIGWYYSENGTPVYRLYSPKFNNHLYTSNMAEITLITTRYGWVYDFDRRPVMYSNGPVSIYRLYNPSLSDQHHLTTSNHEYNIATQWGWRQEGIAMQAEQVGVPENTHYYK